MLPDFPSCRSRSFFVGWNLVLLVLRIWLGYVMIKNGNCVIQILTSPSERTFFRQWFGDELHFPFPVFMAVLAKGTEFVGGIAMLIGFGTRIAATLIAFTMLVATFTANLGENFNIDGGFTISYCLFALLFITWGAGWFSADKILFPNYRMWLRKLCAVNIDETPVK